MESFSVRHGHEPKKEPQVDAMDDDLKRRITDVIYERFHEVPMREVWIMWVKRPVSDMLRDIDGAKQDIIKKCQKTPTHHEMYTLLEIIVRHMNDYYREGFVHDMNGVLVENMSAWRIEGDTVVRVMGELDTQAMHEAASISEENAELIRGALKAMGVNDPDFKTSITLSAKMAESTLNMVGGRGHGIGQKLDSVVKGLGLPGSIVESFKQMNGFANEFARHAHDKSTYESDRNDAMVALVWFSAMSNYLHWRWRDRGSRPAG